MGQRSEQMMASVTDEIEPFFPTIGPTRGEEDNLRLRAEELDEAFEENQRRLAEAQAQVAARTNDVASLETQLIAIEAALAENQQSIDRIKRNQQRRLQILKYSLCLVTAASCITLPSVIRLTKEIKPLKIFGYNNTLTTIAETHAALTAITGICLSAAIKILECETENPSGSIRKLFLNKSMLCSAVLGLAGGWQLENYLVSSFNPQLTPIALRLVVNTTEKLVQ